MERCKVSVFLSGSGICNSVLTINGTNYSKIIRMSSRRFTLNKFVKNLQLEYMALNPSLKSLVRITVEKVVVHSRMNGFKNLLQHLFSYKVSFYIDEKSLDKPISFQVGNSVKKTWVSRLAILNGVIPYSLNHSQEYDFARFQDHFSAFVWDFEHKEIKKHKTKSVFRFARQVHLEDSSIDNRLLFRTLRNASIFHSRTVINKDIAIPTDAHNFIDSSWPSDFIFSQNGNKYLFEGRFPIEKFDGKYVFFGSSTSWFHFLIEVFPRYLQCERTSLEDRVPIIEKGTPEQIVEVLRLAISKKPYQLDSYGEVVFEDLLICTESRYPNGLELLAREGDIRKVRSFFGVRFQTSKFVRTSKVFIIRNKSLFRRTEIMEPLSHFCTEFGFDIVDTGTMSLSEQIELFASAIIIIGETGSSLTNLIFCNPGTKVLEINLLNFMPGFFRDFCRILELPHFEIEEIRIEGGDYFVKFNDSKVRLSELIDVS